MVIRCRRIQFEFEPELMANGCVLDLYPELRCVAGGGVLIGEDEDTQTWRLENAVDVTGIDGIEVVSE